MSFPLRCKSFSFSILALAGSAALMTTGCGMSDSGVTQAKTIVTPAATVATGMVHGGQQPVTGATIQLWEAGGTYATSTGTYGSAAKNILTTTVTTSTGNGSVTGANVGNVANTLPMGSFTLSPGGVPLYTCDSPATGISSPYVYLTASGGNAGAGTNPAITLVAALGPCSGLTTSTYTFIDEVTTVAAAYALAQFAAPPAGTSLSAAAVASLGTSTVDAFGAPSTNLKGLVNAFNTAQVLASTVTGSANTSIATPNLYGNTTTTTANVEYWQINLVADILAACVNGTTAMCTGAGSVGTLATPSGSTAAVDTLQAAVYMAQNPGGGPGAPAGYAYNLASLVSATPPFQPYSTVAAATSTSPIAPTDLTIGITYTSASFTQTSGIAADANGNIWVAGSTATSPAVVELDPVGNIIGSPITSYKVGTTATNFAGNNGANFQLGIAVDTNNNAWVADYTSSNIFEIPGSGTRTAGSTTASTNNGTNVSGGTGAVGFATGVASSEPSQIAVDGNNDIWFTQQTGSSGSCGTAGNKEIGGFLSSAYGTYVPGMATSSNPYGIAIDGGISTGKEAYDTYSGGAAIVGAPFIWSIDEAGGTIGTAGIPGTGHLGVLAMGYTGSNTAGMTGNNTTGAGCGTPLGLISTTGTSSGVTTTLNENSATINGTSTTYAFGGNPYGIAIDSTGNLWVANNALTDATGDIFTSITKMTPHLSTETSPLTPAQAKSDFTFSTFPNAYNPSQNTSTAGTQTVSTLAAGGIAASGVSGQAFNPRYVAVDGGGNAWVSGFPGGTNYITPVFSVVELNNAGLALSPATVALNTNAGAVSNPATLGVGGFIGGFVSTSATPTAYTAANHRVLDGGMGITVDGSGNVWVANDVTDATLATNAGSGLTLSGVGAVTEIVGSAVPTVMPLSLGIANGTLGTKP